MTGIQKTEGENFTFWWIKTAIYAVAVFPNGNGSRVPHLLDEIQQPIASLTGDRGYDQNSVYRTVLSRNKEANIVIHPRSNAVMSSGSKKWTQRDRHLQKIIDDGIYTWRRESGYYQQNRVENTFYRYKTIIGKRLRAREVEAKIACGILNQFLELGGVQSERVA